jgi:Tol biopolymer transport system component
MSKREGVVRPTELSRSEGTLHSDPKNAVRATVSSLSVLIPFVLAWTIACRENTGPRPTGVDSLPNISGLIVSAPTRGPAALGGSRALVAAGSFDESVVYVSLAPGSVPAGLEATIQDVATGQSITTEVVQGGFDPVAIHASIGDTLIVEVTGISADKSRAVRIVALPRPPYVVRTDPTPKKRDVALNSAVVIVFSEPMDPATVGTGSVTLLRGTMPVPGTVRFADVEHLRAEFHPDVLLAAQTDYQLVLSRGIRSVNGLALDSIVAVPFSTGSSIGYSIGGTVSGLKGVGLVLRFNSGESLPVPANGPIAFAPKLPSGAFYSITVLRLPSSPDQLCIVAGGEGNVGSANVTDIAITCSDADPSLTGQILFTTSRDAAPDILVLDLDRSTITRLTSGTDDWDHMPQWSPDRSRIAFVRQTRNAAFGSWDSYLWVMSADGSGAHEIGVGGAPGFGQWFSWSPDGTRLAVFGGSGFSIINADGSGMIMWKNPLAGTAIFSPAWSPDGSTIAFFGDTPNAGLTSFFQVQVVDADGSNVRRLTSVNTYGGTDPAERNPAWSPDGTKLTFWSAAFGLTVATRDGTAAYSASHDDWRSPSGLEGFSVQGDAAPDWSPDGKHLVFQMHGQLFVTMADGSGNPRQLTSVPGGAFDPAWLK